MSKKYYEEIDIIKGIAIMLVVLGHSVIVYPIDLHEIFWCKTVYDFVRTMHMPLFFIVSGFCLSYKDNYKEFIKKKCKRILIPYLIFNIIDTFPRALIPSLVNRPRSFGESIYSICCEGGAYWFLYSLFLIFLIFPGIIKIVKTDRSKFALCLCCLLLKFVPDLPEVFLIRRTIYHLFYFVVGFSLRGIVSVESTRSIVKEYRLVSMALATGLLFAILVLCPVYAVEDNQLLGIPLAFMGIIAVVIISILLKNSIFRNYLIGFGKYSLGIYLLNGFLLTITRTVTVSILHIQTPTIIIFVNFFADLVISYYLIKWIFSRYKVSKFAFGMC